MDKKRKFFNKEATSWEQNHQHLTEKQKLAEFFPNLCLKSCQKVLDIGCGSGRLTPLILKTITRKGLLIEADFSEKMLSIAKKKFNHKNKLYFVQTDAHHLPFKNGSFDVIVALAFFPHLSEPKIALGEFRRILKSAGHIIIAHQMSRLELNEFHQKIKGPVTRDLLPEAKKMKFMLKEAGFQKIIIKDQPSLYIAEGIAI